MSLQHLLSARGREPVPATPPWAGPPHWAGAPHWAGPPTLGRAPTLESLFHRRFPSAPRPRGGGSPPRGETSIPVLLSNINSVLVWDQLTDEVQTVQRVQRVRRGSEAPSREGGALRRETVRRTLRSGHAREFVSAASRMERRKGEKICKS